MDQHYYDQLRSASQEEFYEAINSPEHELYDILWDLFETVVIEPSEVYDPDFGNHNQFRYSIGNSVTMEFFPDSAYFERRLESNPYRDGGDAAGIHLRFTIQPQMSCLFSVSFQIWGRPERLAFKKLWKGHRNLVLNILRKAKPMVGKRIPFPAMDFAGSLEEMLDNYFAVRDSESFLEFQYPFAQFDETDFAQDFMIYMGLLYHAIREQCQHRRNEPEGLHNCMRGFYSGHLPELPPPLPSVELVIPSGID